MSDRAPRSSRRPPKARSGLLQAVLGLSAAQQRTAAAALVVLVSLGTPWYSTEVVFPGTAGKAPSVSHGTMSGIAAFSFVEAAVLLVAAAVLALVWARATDKSFSLPAADGTVVTGAAGWLGVLIVYRLFDRPEGKTDGGAATLIGLSWGIFATLAAVGLLLATGLDQRRRDAELRASTADPADGPVLDPSDVVPVGGPGTADRAGTGGRGASGDRAGTGGAAPYGGSLPSAGAAPGGEPAQGPPTGGRPAWDGPAPATPAQPEVAPGRPEWAGPAAPAPQRPQDPRDLPPADPRPSRSWSFDDPDTPEPLPHRSEPSRRRPTPPPDPDRPLGRDDAAAELRDAGLGGDGARRGGPATPGPQDPTRVAPWSRQDDPTRVAPWGEDDPTRAVPAPGAYDPATGQTDVTRRQDVPPPTREDDADRGSRRRRRRRPDES